MPIQKEKEFIYQPKASYKLMLKRGESTTSDYSYKEDLDYHLPIYKGDKVGTIEVYNGNKLEKTIDLVSTSEIHSKFAFFTESNFFKILFKIILFLIFAFVLFVLFIALRKKYRKKLRRTANKNKRKNTKSSKNTRTTKNTNTQRKNSNNIKRKPKR